MKILVIGGSYFLGRVFVMTACKEHEITVFNRGTYSMKEFPVKEIAGDRKDPESLKHCADDYDVVVDLCAYEAGDIQRVISNLKRKPKQYIFISTVDVYERDILGYKEETTSFEYRQIPSEAGAYIAGKVALEQELISVCEKEKIAHTVLRPSILYGPYNYAPRESVFVQLMATQNVLPVIVDAEGRFQFVYVKDVAMAIGKCLLNQKAYGEAFNICGNETMDYLTFGKELERAWEIVVQEKNMAAIDGNDRKDGGLGKKLQVIEMTKEVAEANHVPLPFPLTEEETELYSNEKSKQILEMAYESFREGIIKTVRAFSHVYS